MNDTLRVAVTGANGRVGSMLLEQLQAQKVYTIALVRKASAIKGADEIMGDWMTAPAALHAMQNADVIVHLTGELFTRDLNVYQEANVNTTKRVVEALRSGSVKRVITISYVGADPNSVNHYLRTNGIREKLLLESGKEAIIFRCPAIINTPASRGNIEEAFEAKNGKPVQMLGNGKQKMRPIYRADVVKAIITALNKGTTGVYDLVGPEEMSADELIQLLNCNKGVKISHIPGGLARIMSRFIAALPPTYVDVALRDSTGDPSHVTQEFGLNLTSLRTIWH